MPLPRCPGTGAAGRSNPSTPAPDSPLILDNWGSGVRGSGFGLIGTVVELVCERCHVQGTSVAGPSPLFPNPNPAVVHGRARAARRPGSGCGRQPPGRGVTVCCSIRFSATVSTSRST